MKLLNSAIALGIGAATAAGLSLLKINKDLVIGSTAIVIGAGMMIALKEKNDLNTKAIDYEYFFNRAQDKFELADYEEAILDYNKALELSPTEICLVYSMRGNAKRNLGDFDGAISDQNKALNFDPLYADAYFNRSSAKFQKGDFDGAIEDYSQVITINPKDSDAFFNRANVKQEVGDIQGACEDWRKAADLGDEEATDSLKRFCNND
ncbi:tetratricopeptide repeat protein [Prochlorococcus marinus]|uniref:tetratricopeptide repeat protein n=1 Tax=Prochlorococcus marinus TaxID=1219 RepID=UPI0022B3DA26|nr:tetratricopeptide repeat protein [Prochlorococcus marinus]